MFTVNHRIRRDANPTGKLQHVPRLGVEHHQRQSYQGFAYQIDRRALGMTVKRIQFSVNIVQDNRQVAYLSNLSSEAQANQAARAWIDAEVERRGEIRTRQWKQLGKNRETQ